MRPVVISLTVLLLAAAAPALASGLPKVASIQIGPHQVALYNDSPTLVTGSNTLTVEIGSLPDDSTISLSLSGPQGQTIDVPLKPVLLLGGHDEMGDSGHDAMPMPASGHDAAPNSGHDGMDMGGHGAMPNSGHDGMDMGGPDAADGHSHDAKAASYQVCGTATVPSIGVWTARLTIHDRQGRTFSGEVPLEAIEGGPNKLYLGATSFLIIGSVVFGAVQRRRQAGLTAQAHWTKS